MAPKVEYHANNSGGSWWLTDENWYALENAGWKVHWIKDDTDSIFAKGDRWLGALAKRATRYGLTITEAIEEWESVTGQDARELGCYSCCGPPHAFQYWKDENDERNYVYISPDAPAHGTLNYDA